MCEIFLNGGAPYPGQSNDAVRVGICCGDLRYAFFIFLLLLIFIL